MCDPNTCIPKKEFCYIQVSHYCLFLLRTDVISYLQSTWEDSLAIGLWKSGRKSISPNKRDMSRWLCTVQLSKIPAGGTLHGFALQSGVCSSGHPFPGRAERSGDEEQAASLFKRRGRTWRCIHHFTQSLGQQPHGQAHPQKAGRLGRGRDHFRSLVLKTRGEWTLENKKKFTLQELKVFEILGKKISSYILGASIVCSATIREFN